MIGLVLALAVATQPPLRPDATLTPGVTSAAVTQANIATTICVHGYTAGVRNVPGAVKSAVFKEYGVNRRSGKFEIDHLISLELGGANDIHNLWPQSYTTMPMNAHVKDALEDRLHVLVCTGKVPLVQAQHDIATDWIAANAKYPSH